MFSDMLSTIGANLLTAEQIPPLVPPEAHPCREYRRLQETELQACDLPAKDYAEQLRRVHLRRLTAVLTDAEMPAHVQLAAESVHVLLNLATWTDASQGDPFRYDPCGTPDSAFAETCCAVAAALNMLRRPFSALSANLTARMESELLRRMSPVVTDNSLPLQSLPLDVVCRLLTAALLGLSRESVRWTAVSRLCRALDAILNRMPADGSADGSLEEAAETAALLMDTAEVIRISTENQVDLTQDDRIACMADFLLFSHLQAGQFLNPGEHTMTPDFDAESLFRFGLRTGDGALCDLSAWLLHAGRDVPAAHLLSRLLNRSTSAQLDAHAGRLRLFREGFLPNAGLMFMRGFHMTAMLNGATHTAHADAGNLCLFWRDQPLLIDLGGNAAASDLHTVPTVNGLGQCANLPRTRTETGVTTENCTCCTVSLTDAYPPEACLSDYQRTLLMGAGGLPGIRLMDMLELTQPLPVDFHFLCAVRPEPASDGIDIGPVTLQWDVPLKAAVQSINRDGRTCFRLTLHAEPARRHRVVFEFIPK